MPKKQPGIERSGSRGPSCKRKMGADSALSSRSSAPPSIGKREAIGGSGDIGLFAGVARRRGREVARGCGAEGSCWNLALAPPRADAGSTSALLVLSHFLMQIALSCILSLSANGWLAGTPQPMYAARLRPAGSLTRMQPMCAARLRPDGSFCLLYTSPSPRDS